ncbi:MAG: 2-oxoglutarate dehydrogenase E1 component, partial [Spirochaetales bacterium]|nr:2-oxoglutarate dehydrogenase E1 component [Spirochaetales bacterium]
MRDQALTDLESLAYQEELYAAWRQDPGSVGPRWDAYFRALEEGRPWSAQLPESERRPAGVGAAGVAAAPGPAGARPSPGVGAGDLAWRQSRVDSLLWAYRDVGYFYARLNPLVGTQIPSQNYLYPRAKGAYEQLSLEAFGLSQADLGTEFSAGRAMKPSRAPLSDILAAFDETYCSTFGVEFLHIQNKPIRNWLLAAMESCRNRPSLSDAQRRTILEDLIRAEGFEQFLHKTFIGQKRFSLEGSEVLIPALHFLLNTAAGTGVEEIVLGTTHRGRITILNLILGKPADEIFALFEDNHAPGQYGGSGDVKYHLGYSTDHAHEDGSAVHVTLASNPSHLESVDGVVEGKVRGEQDRPSRGSFWKAIKRVMPVVLHGDAAFSGQGVVAEVFNMSQLQGYHTGGTIHIVINNQIGFTTSGRDARSTYFPTDVAKMTSVPVFHVNGDDPEAVVYAVDLALRYRQKFSMDVVIDIVCFRRHGHNEGDEPSFTNPRMYETIRSHPGPAAIYGQRCAEAGIMGEEEQGRLRKEFGDELRQALKRARENPPEPTMRPFQGKDWEGLQGAYSHASVPTGVDEEALRRIARTLTAVPEGFHAHPKLARILEEKAARLADSGSVDWAFAEGLAFGTLLEEGHPVRLSGQDCERGTFSQRHAAWWDTEEPDAEPYVPLNHLSAGQARFHVYDSPLSEYSILGFEYGYSLSAPRSLVLWEAQFGDFSNGAQVVIDNFIAAAQAKWQRASGLVLLLPHGYEGQGPEHSSAHLERFLQLCAEENLEVCNLTTPAQYFHLLRRHLKRDFRRPLVLMSPKSLLRHPLAVSRLEEMGSGSFQPVLSEGAAAGGATGEGGPAAAEVERVVLCSGKLFYELWERRRELETAGSSGAEAEGAPGAGGPGRSLGGRRTALLRLEQLYPFPAASLEEALAVYPGAKRYLWAQEEPANRGALRHV